MTEDKESYKGAQDTQSRDPALDAPSSGPSGNNGSMVRCSRCRKDVPSGDQCSSCGSFLPSNEASLRHGLRRYQTTGVLPADLKESVDTFREGLISDQGGLNGLSTIRAGLCGILVDAEVGRQLLMREVIKRGIDSKPGRSAYEKLLSTWDRWHRFAVTLGVERRAKPVRSAIELLQRGDK